MNGIFVLKVICRLPIFSLLIIALLLDSTNVEILFISVKSTLSIFINSTPKLHFYDSQFYRVFHDMYMNTT